jgi:protease PrsW
MEPGPAVVIMNSWWRVLVTIFWFFVIGIVILALTDNPNIFPTVVILGNFMVPASYVAFFYERRHLSKLTMPTTAMCFFYGGVLSIFAAALIEPFFVTRLNFLSAFQVGLIEEFAKIAGVLMIARRGKHDSSLDGLILGGAAGMGFAALESTGYTFTTFLISQGSLTTAVGVTMLRGVLSPLGHGTWTAILAGVCFGESRNGRFVVNGRVLRTYLGVSLLHGCWDGLPSLIAALTSSGKDILIANALIGAVGLFILARMWKKARREQIARLAKEEFHLVLNNSRDASPHGMD